METPGVGSYEARALTLHLTGLQLQLQLKRTLRLLRIPAGNTAPSRSCTV